MAATQQVTGIASGFDTASIVEQLMKIEKIPYEKLEYKKETQKLKLQAYQAVNTMFLKFKNSVSTLSSQKLWKSKSATSTNENSLTATANEYAVNGTYAFRVAQLATATQYMSKGFASSKTALVKQPSDAQPYKLGSISMSSAKTRVDNSAKLDVLNGGKGVYRGSVRITDANNSTSIIDLSGCDTMDDVVRALNESTGAQINASIKDGKLYIEDASNGTGSLKIQNVGNGTTATDLGIAGSASTPGGGIHGRNVYVMGNDTAVTMLQDGLGIEEGIFHLRVSDTSSYIDVHVNVDECGTVGDIIERVNREIQYLVDNNEVDSSGNGAAATLLKDLKFGISEDKNSFSLTGTTQHYTYQFYNDENDFMGNAQPATDLGLDVGRKTATQNGEEIKFGRVLGDVNSPMIKNLSGVNDNGVGYAGRSSYLPLTFNGGTLLRHMNNGQGLDISRPLQIRLTEGGDDVSNSEDLTKTFSDIVDQNALKALTDDPDSTITDLVLFLNDQIDQYAKNPANNAAGLTGMKFMIDEAGQSLVVQGAQGGYKVEILGTMAGNLGLTRFSGIGTDIDIDSTNYADYAVREASRNKFYGMDGSNKILTDGSGEIKSDTTLYDLNGLHGVDFDDENTDYTAAVNTALDAIFASGTLDLDLNGTPVSITRQDLADRGLTTIDSTTKVEDLVNTINLAIRDKAPAGMSAPQLRVHTYGNGLQWSNMDFTKDFSASGSLAAAFGVDKSTTGTVEVDGSTVAMNFGSQYLDSLGTPLKCAAIGYWEEKTPDSTNLDQIKIGHLGNGANLSFAGNDNATLDFDLGAGKTFSIKMGDLRMDQTTNVEDYLAHLNALVQDELDQINSSLAPADQVALKFQIEDGKMQVTGVKNADKLVISGDGANVNATGVGAVNIESIDSADDETTIYDAGELKARVFNEQDPGSTGGLGDIKLKVGDTEATLSTAGLTGDDTLAKLVDKLNDELARHVAMGSPYEDFANVRFTINSAGTGIAVENDSAKKVTFIDTKDANMLAQDLGLVDIESGKGVEVDSYTFHNSGSLGRKIISRATKISDYMGTAEVGVIKITNSLGATWNADLSNCKTVGDVVDFINSAKDFGVYAQINERGDGFDIIEYWGDQPAPAGADGNISIADLDGGTVAKKLGIAGTGSRDPDVQGGASLYRNSERVEIDVMSSDTLESLMYRISEKGGYKTAIINDGSASNPYRLTIASANTGEANDFIIESDLDIFGFNQTSRAKDSKVLFGDPNSGSSPIMLSSSTNSNSNAILGITLDMKQTTSEYVTITVDTDKEKVTEEIKNMVQTYNDLNDLVSYLDAYDEESGEPGVLFGDTSVRSFMEEINDMFYLVFNPNQKMIGSVDDKGVQNTWTWMDMGVSLSAKNSNSDGTGNWYSSMDLDLDKLDEMVAKNWDVLYNMLAGQRNASNSTLEESVKATSTFNGKAAEGFSTDNAINGDSNKGSWGVNNGFMADGTIKDGQNEYTIYFQGDVTLSRLSIYHYDTDTALKNFDVEYLDSATGKWEMLREVKNNSVDANHLGFAVPTTVSAIRVKAHSTNATDDKFRLLDIQVFEDIGLAGKLNQLTTSLGDTSSGFLADRNTEITESLKEIEDQMEKLQEKLDKKEEGLWRRFTAMETAMSKLQNQSDYFSSMMGSMNSSSSKK